MIKEFFLKKMLASKLGSLPKDQQDMIIKAVSENPELFQKIATEAKAKMDTGKDQMTAMMEVMQAHQAELQAVLKPKN